MMTEEEFRLFRNLIYEESGICLRESRKDFLENRLAARMKATGMSSLYWYYRLVCEKRKTELLILLDILTINETSFFRNRPQMDFFRDEILPAVIKAKDTRKDIRIWSAGCSTGEEPYSIAMLVSEVLADLAHWDVRIFASDISLTAIETAARGEYESDKVRTTADDYFIRRYFDEGERCYRVKDTVKKMVVFDFHNLKNDNGIGDLDIIFCRNVMIYFDIEEQRRLVNKFYDSLNPGSYLLIGHAETLQGINPGFRFLCRNNGTAYRKFNTEVNYEHSPG